MAWDIPGAIQSVADAFRDVFGWNTGGRTKDENAIRTDAETAHDDFQTAVESGDIERINTARDRQRAVRDEARAKRP